MKKFLIIIGAWLSSLVIVFAFPLDIPFATAVAILLFYLSAFILVIAFLITLFRQKDKREPLIAILLVILISVVMFNKGLLWGARLHLLVNKSRYEKVVESLASTQSSEERKNICGEDCITLSNEPVSVAFHFCHWFLNWKDVYDPTGSVNVEYLPPDERPTIYFIKGEHLFGDWYLCHFAD